MNSSEEDGSLIVPEDLAPPTVPAARWPAAGRLVRALMYAFEVVGRFCIAWLALIGAGVPARTALYLACAALVLTAMVRIISNGGNAGLS